MCGRSGPKADGQKGHRASKKGKNKKGKIQKNEKEKWKNKKSTTPPGKTIHFYIFNNI